MITKKQAIACISKALKVPNNKVKMIQVIKILKGGTLWAFRNFNEFRQST